MNSEVRQVKKERLVFMSRNEINGFISQEIGEVLTFGIFDIRVCCKVKVLSGTDDGFIETSLTGKVFTTLSDMPLAENTGRITRRF